MPKIISVFRSPEGEQQYHAAYEAVLKEWPVPYYEELYIPTRLVAGLQTEIVPNANHFAEYSPPGFVNRKILEFLADEK
jgi:hypothetical protein